MDLYNEYGDLVGYYPEAVGLPRSSVRDARKAARKGGRSDRREGALSRIGGGDREEAAKAGYLIPDSDRRLALPLSSATAIAAGAEATLSVNVQKPFQPEKLILSSADIAGWVVLDVKVGTRSQFASDGDAPAEAFTATAVYAGFEMDPASPGIVITVRVRNDNAAAAAISGMLYGQSIS